MGDLIQARPRAPSLPLMQVQVTAVLTACPGGLISSESAKPATVQSDCSEMQVTNSVNQSLPTAIIQGNAGTNLVDFLVHISSFQYQSFLLREEDK